MRTSLLRLAVALATFGFGVTLATLWLGLTTSSFKPSYKRDSCRWRQRAVPAPVPALPPAPAAVAPAPPAVETLKMETCEPAAPGEFAGRTVVGGVLNGKAVSKPAPAYPAPARQAHVSGTVAVHVVVNECGEVERADAVSGHPLLRDAARDAAYKSVFTPTRISGEPVKVTGTITYNFVLQ